MFEWWATVEPIAWMGGKLLLAVRYIRNIVRPAQPALHWIERLNASFSSELRIHRALTKEPKILLQGPLKLADDAKRLVAKHRKNLSINDHVLVLVGTADWNDNPVVLRAYSTDYASVCALDELGQRPTMLSANAVMFCRDTDELILHRRSDKSRDYAGYLHTFGGAFSQDYDHLSLTRTARRETLEESGVAFELRPVPELLLGQELRIGFLHLALLGVGISRSALETAIANPEGDISLVKVCDLARTLQKSDWVPAGKAQVLAWLALGAPIGRRRVRFGKLSGQELFNELVA